MPKELHDALERQAEEKGLTGKRKDAYIYGTMRNTGWKPEREKKAMLTFEDKINLLKHSSLLSKIKGLIPGVEKGSDKIRSLDDMLEPHALTSITNKLKKMEKGPIGSEEALRAPRKRAPKTTR